MPNYREALTSDEKAQELTGFNMYDGDEEPQIVDCKRCGKSYPADDFDVGLCSECRQKIVLDTDGRGTTMRGEL